MTDRVAFHRLVAALLLVAVCGGRAGAATPGGEVAPAGEAAPGPAAIRFYQRYISTLRHGHCQFAPSCSEYAAQSIAAYGLAGGSARAADRLIRCNASAAGFYPRGRDGRLEDPVDPAAAVTGGPRIPSWMLLAGEPSEPPVPDTLPAERRVRLEETVTFAIRLAQRGDCERASTEFQRAGSIAGDAATDAWAFARIGECEFAAGRWPAAEGAFLTSGMLATSPASRSRAVFRAAVCRFDAGSFAACERLMADTSVAGDAVQPDRVATLGGLCALARGGWAYAADEFSRAAALAPDSVSSARIARLAPFAARGPMLPHRSSALAASMSAVLPGAGQVYCGRGADGLRHLLFDTALVWTVVSLARDHRGPAAYLTAGLTLPFYLGNVLGARDAARRHDRDRRLALVQRAVRESVR